MRRLPSSPGPCRRRRIWRLSWTAGCVGDGTWSFPTRGQGWERSASRKRNGTSLKYRKVMRRKAEVQILTPKQDEKPLAPLVRKMLEGLGENPDRDGLVRTPERVE